jgi:hypothetical protein
MSDIKILSDWPSLILLFLLLGSPGIPIGAIAGAILLRSRRMFGALIGAIIGYGSWLLGWLYFSDNL